MLNSYNRHPKHWQHTLRQQNERIKRLSICMRLDRLPCLNTFCVAFALNSNDDNDDAAKKKTRILLLLSLLVLFVHLLVILVIARIFIYVCR